ncbi:hypothetical protein AGOR_G00126690 [Albula goreensis]|uniref:Cystatin LXN-type domain-containing protein n=1 Tax=Albula goreensis TaxID=1534307 RepID=A0A8T3DC14_9TELE|nr:hypothetical protein AGOR_G00126690 [Albula goreensis]
MSWSLCLTFTLLSLGQGVPIVQDLPKTGHSNSDVEPILPTGEAMSVKQLNPAHYPASRAANAALHYLNTQHGSPYRWLQVERVLDATVEEVAEIGMKYNVQFAVKDVTSEQSVGVCSSEVLYPVRERQTPPRVQCFCENLLKLNSYKEEEALYQQLSSNNSLLSGHDIPDSYGFIATEMRPFWHLGAVASSFVMLKESNESTLYNMAQVANVTQLETQNETLKFQYHVLLHEMVSQEIIHWKLIVSWCPAEGVRVLTAEWQPKCEHCVVPPANTTNTVQTSSSE